ncbi:MAG: SURF1 family cytochrome oxidase biogenesis protein [Motilibacteraceae bacterium]
MHRLLATRRWLGFVAFAVVVSVGCLLLARWQVSRAHEHGAQRRLLSTNLARPAAPLTDVLAVGRRADADQYRQVRVSGRYDPARTVLVRNRPYNSVAGFEVLVPLVTADGSAVLVDRGWVPRAGAALGAVDVPAPPTGQVTVTGWVEPGVPTTGGQQERTEGAQVSVARVDPLRLAGSLPYPLYGGYVDAGTESPAPTAAIQRLDAPTLDGYQVDPGRNWSYALQWVVFGIIGVVGSVVLLRRELDEDTDELEEPGEDEAPTPSGRPRLRSRLAAFGASLGTGEDDDEADEDSGPHALEDARRGTTEESSSISTGTGRGSDRSSG